MQIAAGDPRKLGKKKLQQKLEAEPNATRGLPGCPEHLNGRAKAAWEFWAEELAVMNIDRRPDAQMLEGACVNYGRAVEADLILEEKGLTVEEPVVVRGQLVGYKIKKNPAVDVSNAAWRQVRAFCSEFGLSPTARTRLTLNPQEKTESLMDLLSKPRQPRGDDMGVVQ